MPEVRVMVPNTGDHNDELLTRSVALPPQVVIFSWTLGDYVFLRAASGKEVVMRGQLIGVRALWSNGDENRKEYLVRYVTPIGSVHVDWYGERELDSDTT